MPRKAPRRTAERIQETALALFNRFGEPDVSTTQIAAELRISAGNLYYHYRTKDELVAALFDHHLEAMAHLLPAAAQVRDVEDAWFFMHSLFERVWQHRFLYRDLTLLLTRNRHLETGMRQLMADKVRALEHLLAGLQSAGALRIDEESAQRVATSAVVMVSYWLSFEYARDPRHALEPEGLQMAVLRGAGHVLGLLVPYLEPAPQAHLRRLMRAYETPAATAGDRT